jgi:exosortase
VLAFYLLLSGGGFFLLGSRVMRGAAFPFLFLLFMIPPPAKVMEIAEIGLQYASAETAIRFIKLTGTPVYREGLVFVMPRLAIEVARECSGIRSSLVLFITSLVAGNVLLSHWWTRLILALIVIPLGIVRNAIRVLVISMLSVHVDASYIHSPIHRQGGPIFFALSLVPFAIILFWLKRIESRNIRGT